jgi:threonine dehydrogenase-like Zn-dependent dehydrogenase
MTDIVCVPGDKLYSANLSLKELSLAEPPTVGAHAVARGRVTGEDIVAVFGCGGVALGAISSAAFRNAIVIAIDVDDIKLETARKAEAKHLILSSAWQPPSTIASRRSPRALSASLRTNGMLCRCPLASDRIQVVLEVALATSHWCRPEILGTATEVLPAILGT